MISEEGMGRENVEIWESPRGRLLVSQPVLGVMVFTYRGHMSAPVVPFIERSVDRVLAGGIRPDLFVDLGAMSGYDSDYRKAVSQWGAKNYRRFGEVRFFVRSKLVAMGIAVSNLTAAGKIRPTTDRAQFQAALDAAVSRHSAPPPPVNGGSAP